MSLDKALQQCMGTIPECIAAGYVDMSTGMLLAVRTVDRHPQEILDMLAAATADVFQGGNVVTIEQMWKKVRGGPVDDRHYFQEIIMLSDNHMHVFFRCKKNPTHSVIYVSNKDANIGMVIARARMTIAPLEEAVWRS